ncbi:hypothetical protein CR513_48755, partial [Mucuna pruriens]
LFSIRVVSELFDLKDVLLGRRIKSNTNKMIYYFRRKYIFLFLLLKSQTPYPMKNETLSINKYMSTMGIKLEDEILELLLLNSLPKS